MFRRLYKSISKNLDVCAFLISGGVFIYLLMTPMKSSPSCGIRQYNISKHPKITIKGNGIKVIQ